MVGFIFIMVSSLFLRGAQLYAVLTEQSPCLFGKLGFLRVGMTAPANSAEAFAQKFAEPAWLVHWQITVEHFHVVRALKSCGLGAILLAHAADHLGDRLVFTLIHPADQRLKNF